MNRYKVLFLTDHITHNKFNSIYLLVNSCLNHTQTESVHIASRSYQKNESFFKHHNTDIIFTSKVTKPINYKPENTIFSIDTIPVKFSDFNLIILRIPNPVSDSLLEYLSVSNPHAIFINNPKGMSEAGNKKYLLEIPEVCAPIKYCTTAKDIIDFSSLHPIVIKPLKSYGGKGIVKIENQQVYDGINCITLEDYLESVRNILENEGFLAMKFLKNVDKGDKRLIVVNKKIVASSLRLPAKGNWLCNVAQGGKSEITEISNHEKELISKIADKLLDMGVVIFGADTLVDDDGKRVISELNTMSVGGIAPAQLETGINVGMQVIDEFFKYADSKKLL